MNISVICRMGKSWDTPVDLVEFRHRSLHLLHGHLRLNAGHAIYVPPLAASCSLQSYFGGSCKVCCLVILGAVIMWGNMNQTNMICPIFDSSSTQHLCRCFFWHKKKTARFMTLRFLRALFPPPWFVIICQILGGDSPWGQRHLQQTFVDTIMTF